MGGARRVPAYLLLTALALSMFIDSAAAPDSVFEKALEALAGEGGGDSAPSLKEIASRVKPRYVEEERRGEWLEPALEAGVGTRAGPPPRPPAKPAYTQIFGAGENPAGEGWSMLVEEPGRLVFVTAWGNYSILRQSPHLGVNYRVVTFYGEEFNVTMRYAVMASSGEAAVKSSEIVSASDYSVAYRVRCEGFEALVEWRLYPGPPKSTVKVAEHRGWFRVALITEGLRDRPLKLGALGERSIYEARDSKSYLKLDFTDEKTAELYREDSRLVALFKPMDDYIDPYVYVVGPSTVDPGFNSAGEKTILTMNTDLPAGANLILLAIIWNPNLNAGSNTAGTIRIKKGTTILAETYSHLLNEGGMRGKPVLLIAYDSSAGANQQYTATINITTAGTATGSIHVQGMAISVSNRPFYAQNHVTSISAGSTVNVATLNTNYSAGSRVVVIAAFEAGVTSTAQGHRLYAAGAFRIVRGTTTVASEQFQTGTAQATEPSFVALVYYDSNSPANPSYHAQFYNSLSETSQCKAWIASFIVANAAFLDTGSVALTSGSTVTVGNLSTSLSGDVAVIGLAAAESTRSTDVTAFNANDVALQRDNSATGQVANLVGWFLERGTYHGRSGIAPLFRYDTGVTNPSYQIKMTARASGLNGEAKIIAFHAGPVLVVKYSVAAGGNPVSGQILMRYYFGGTLRRLVLSTSFQAVSVDAGSTINADFISSGSTSSERWAYSGGSNFTMTMPNDFVTLDLLYYNQISVTLYAFTQSPYSSRLSSTNYARVNITYLGGIFEVRTWDGANNQTWVDRGGNVRWYQLSSGSTSTRRWATAGSVTLENIQQPSTSSAYFWEQWRVTWQISMPSGTPLSGSNYVKAYGKQFGGDLVIQPLYTAVTDWVDHNATIYTDTLSTGSNSTRRWINYYGERYVVTGFGTYSFTFQEEWLTRILALDADSASIVKGVSAIRAYIPANGSTFQIGLIEGNSSLIWLIADTDVVVSETTWRGRAVKNGTASWDQFEAKFRVTGPLTYFSHPRLWADLGGSGVEIWLRSQSVVTSVIWDSGRSILYIQSEKRPGETYIYFGGIGRAPRYVYIDGTLFSDVGYEVDTVAQIIRVTVGGGSILLDFEGKTQPKPATDVETLIQQLYAMLSTLTIRQPAGPPITVPILDLSWLREIFVAVAAYVDRVSPVRSSIIFPALFFLFVFGSAYFMLSRLRRRPPTRYPEVVVVRERQSKTGFLKWAAYTLLSTVITVPLLYYVMPSLFPHAFERPPIDFRLFLFAVLAATALSITVVAILMIQSRIEKGVVKE